MTDSPSIRDTNRRKFVEVWLKAYQQKQDLEWVATQLGVTRQAVQQRASYLRGRGVRLPILNKRIVRGEIEGLNALIDKVVKDEQ